MKETKKLTIPREDFRHWLADGKTPLTVKLGPNETATVLKLAKTENIDYLFGTSSLYTETINWSDSLEFCGMYNKTSQRLVLAAAPLTTLVDGLTEEETQGGEVFTEKIGAAVNQRVEQIIGNDRNNLSVTEITSPRLLRDLKEYLEYGAQGNALQWFFSGEELDGQFHSGYAQDELPEAAFLSWLQDPERFIQTEAEQYIQNNQDRLLLEFLENDALMEKYQALVQDTANPIHRIRAIANAIRVSGAKTVTVTIRKEGEDMSFKTGTTPLRGYYTSYSTGSIAASDRSEFERLFGRCATYTAEDITKITYGKRTLYEAPPVQAEGMAEAETPQMGMGGMSL